MTNQTSGERAAPDAHIAHRITETIAAKGTNIHALADETGISYPTLRRSLKGGRSLTFREFGSIGDFHRF